MLLFLFLSFSLSLSLFLFSLLLQEQQHQQTNFNPCLSFSLCARTQMLSHYTLAQLLLGGWSVLAYAPLSVASLPYTLTFIYSLSLTHSPTLSHTYTLIHSHTLSLTLSHAYTQGQLGGSVEGVRSKNSPHPTQKKLSQCIVRKHLCTCTEREREARIKISLLMLLFLQ